MYSCCSICSIWLLEHLTSRSVVFASVNKLNVGVFIGGGGVGHGKSNEGEQHICVLALL